MSDPIRRGISEDLHAVSFGKGVACDYHERPKELAVDEPMLAECIRVAAHPQLTEFPDGWVVDAARCAEHAVEGIVEPTRGFGEALVRVPVQESNGVMSVELPTAESVQVLAYSPPTEGLHPLVIDQWLLDASEPGDAGLTRWTRILGMLDADPPEELSNHIERLIDRSPEVPSALG